MLAIKHGIRVPDGAFIMYPALALDTAGVTPSFLRSAEDTMLPYHLLKTIRNVYTPDPRMRNDIDPFLTPTVASDELLKEMPPVRMIMGTNDVLHDCALIFAHRLLKLGKDVKLEIYREMPHGFMSFDLPSGMAEATMCVERSIDILKDMMTPNLKTQIEEKILQLSLIHI
eukprot:TRINITY_DN7152_c0_g1_i1.p2 TRINITY_DN7152_c0_g1~~TRINITY_DN7152_c0_g1_i1.p2  ORF type:complete len:171 (-),score=14.89 TRINITY_DN7152_c0_g1_i1:60-572(-)